jgi:general secretion pathway protein A
MYESFYGFKEPPFTLLPDPSFLYLGKQHSVASTMLQYGALHPIGTLSEYTKLFGRIAF